MVTLYFGDVGLCPYCVEFRLDSEFLDLPQWTHLELVELHAEADGTWADFRPIVVHDCPRDPRVVI